MAEQQHPLTDEICKSIAASYPYNGADIDHCEHIEDMRAAADWQLEQVIEWIKECPNYDLDFHSECRRMIADIKKAMRSQQQENS
jgi:hypothetical protein